MTVRTEKIQALTGSAPLKLPTELPASKKNVKVDASGNITTPSEATNFSSLGTSGETGWVLLGVADQQDFVTNFKVSIDDAAGYDADDIYMYRLEWMLVGGRNNTGNYFVLSPMNGSTNITQSMTGGCAAGWYKYNTASWSAGVNSASTTGATGYEHWLTATPAHIAGVSSATSLDNMYANPIPWTVDTYAFQGGAWGVTDYYNGAANRHVPPSLEQVNWNFYNGSYNQSTSGHYNINFGQAGTLKKGSVTNSSFADGFTFSTTNGWNGGSSSYTLMGQVNMYGIPKTG